MKIVKVSDAEFLDKFANIVQVIINTLDHNSTITIGLSGGSLIQQFSTIFDRLSIDWNRVKFFFADERKVPFDDIESTFGQYKKHLIDQHPSKISADNFIVIDPNLSVSDCAKDYEEKLKCAVPRKSDDNRWPRFDLILLGLGPDGHTCSLFPGSEALKEDKTWIIPVSNSPKPPPERITLTFPALNHSDNVVFVVKGASKASTVKEVLQANSARPLPAGLVKPKSKNLIWLLDNDAASSLN